MSRFDSYFLMQEEDVKDYILEKFSFFTRNTLTVKEIGDGNLNYVFRITDGHHSIIVKHSGHVARISDEFRLSTDRTIREGLLLKEHAKYVPDLVPVIHHIDEVMKCVVMEDLSNLTVLRSGLQQGAIYPSLGKDLGTYLSETLMRTSDFILDAKDKKALQKLTINPELCEISEDLVFTEPFYNNFSRNEVSPALSPYVDALIYSDDALKQAVAEAKLKFLNTAQSLIHGDFHSGSVFVDAHRTKVIDPEFGFFGPAGYDIGNVLAHLLFSYSHLVATQQFTAADSVAQSIDECIQTFKSQSLAILNKDTRDVALKNHSTFIKYIHSILIDAYTVCGLEIIRRIVGLAKVSDITNLDDTIRVPTEVQLLKFAKSLILHPEEAVLFPSLINLYTRFEEKAA
ncbi:S-methyl-5-thioribose kinase [Macrococcoides canis]|uniref:S-methyl-5-thioribose kinase n=1 Tax=Macrococcoides canis TaxID=1855823 RepID=UPI0020B6F257|nr:S-methyl-5-thioribose kinase [Macrococcus canis]UTH02271.1 S-methyl-5-thioribose kinase [Macrococcus canis]